MNWDRVERLLGAQTLDYLRQKKVAIIGLGSGGGFIATGLAMSGVSQFVLIDPDVMESHNLARHIGDQRDLGRPKVEIARDLIWQRNGDAVLQVIQGKVEDHAHLLDDVDLVISAVDGEGTKYAINELCLAKGKTAVYGGVYERGEGGDVVIIQPHLGPCYACWAQNLREGHITPSPDGSSELDYGLLNERGTLDAEPALWLHVVRIASTQADMALNVLLRDTHAYRALPGNTVILANHALEIVEGRITPPYSAEWITIARDPNCLVCGRQATMQTHQSLDMLADELLNFEEEDHTNLQGESK
jgi:molybdopterin/thiamine biosynthesis adenylyltransferase